MRASRSFKGWVGSHRLSMDGRRNAIVEVNSFPAVLQWQPYPSHIGLTVRVFYEDFDDNNIAY